MVVCCVVWKIATRSWWSNVKLEFYWALFRFWKNHFLYQFACLREQIRLIKPHKVQMFIEITLFFLLSAAHYNERRLKCSENNVCSSKKKQEQKFKSCETQNCVNCDLELCLLSEIWMRFINSNYYNVRHMAYSDFCRFFPRLFLHEIYSIEVFSEQNDKWELI